MKFHSHALFPSTIPISSSVNPYSLYTVASISSSVFLILSRSGRSLRSDPSNSARTASAGSRLAGSIVQFLSVLLEHRQKALIIVLVVALRATVLGVRSSTYDPQVALQ